VPADPFCVLVRPEVRGRFGGFDVPPAFGAPSEVVVPDVAAPVVVLPVVVLPEVVVPAGVAVSFVGSGTVTGGRALRRSARADSEPTLGAQAPPTDTTSALAEMS
jgi:hypothetical protein